jgi:hypothetical protein
MVQLLHFLNKYKHEPGSMTLTKVLRARDNLDDFTAFCDCFLSCVVGRSGYKQNMATTHISELSISSDEAFAILCVENNIEAWDYMISPDTNTKGPDMPPPKYTRNRKDSGKHHGWSAKGINRFNELHEDVESRRRETVQLEADFNAMKMQGLSGQEKRSRSTVARDIAMAVTDLDDLDGDSDDEYMEEQYAEIPATGV